MAMTGLIIGRMMPKNRCRPLAPSSAAASSTSSDTWVSPANDEKATNGTDIQMTMTLATMKKVVGVSSQLNLFMSTPGIMSSR